MPRIAANGIDIEYALEGPDTGPVILLIHGVGAQMIRWPKALCDRLIAAGYRLLRYDSRDIGLSTWCDEAGLPDMAEVLRAKAEGRTPALAYHLEDLAADAAALLDGLGIARAHVVGVSLGGMVAQRLAIDYPAHAASLALVMTQSGHDELPPSNPEALAMLAKPAPDPAVDLQAHLDHQVALNRTLGSPLYPAPEADLRSYAARAAKRAYHPQGAARQLAAARGSADRTAALRQLDVPTLVIHGADDPLIRPECGDQLAAAIPGAWLLKPGGMGHDLPEPLLDLIAQNILANIRRAEGG
ncbi:MAG: alpha/beta hydrolase [Sphingomonadales bacterium]|nr:alpha/beta hydrolase [Sphingomonadales bacterium]